MVLWKEIGEYKSGDICHFITCYFFSSLISIISNIWDTRVPTLVQFNLYHFAVGDLSLLLI